MSEVLEFDEPPLDTAAKRAAIESELRKDAGRSDREIARVVGCDHKTVAKSRGKIVPTASPLKPEPPAKEPEWDPFDPRSDAVVVPAQPAIAVYANMADSVSIRQAAEDYTEDDRIIMIRPEHVEKLIVRLRSAAAEANE